MTFPHHDSVIVPDWPAPARVRAASTQRAGGVSRGSYASLNLGAGVGDESAAVARNRHILAETLDLPAEPVWLRQVHGTTVLDLDEGWNNPAGMTSSDEVHGAAGLDMDENDPPAVMRGAAQSCLPPPAADGAVTSRSAQPCVVLTADCLPVLLCDASGTRVGAMHAGWRGLAGGVLESAVRRMSIDPGRLLAWIGPGIGQEAFEVGREVLDRFSLTDPKAARYW